MLLLIVLLGAVGVCLRYGMMQMLHVPGAAFPYVTLIINVIGSFAAGLLSKVVMSATTKQALFIGLLGAFTTFATYAKELVVLLEQQQIWYAVLYGCLSNVVSVIAVYGGISCTHVLLNCK